ncbi:MAG TPA: hypothetical protein PLL20_07940 [Phycisphaerae bacterium]|nr:hypothetical protein [Phycisphaerae bacterium]HRR86657.1 hypothetical protein [Phycisphaerae bacterium]
MPQRPKKPIEEVVAELGRYPLEAFIFMQECIGAASEQVHGPMTPEESVVAGWMDRHNVDLETLCRLSETGSLPPDIADILAKIGGPEKMNRHVTGQQLCWAVRDVALSRYGLMARSVLAKWNIRRTEDIGAIIFALVENDWLKKLPSDKIEDFQDVYSFDEVFEPDYRSGGE